MSEPEPEESRAILAELLAKAEAGRNLTPADVQRLAQAVRPGISITGGKALAGQTCDSFC